MKNLILLKSVLFVCFMMFFLFDIKNAHAVYCNPECPDLRATITSPGNNTVYDGPQNIVINARATWVANAQTLNRAMFYDGTRLLASVPGTTLNYTYTWTNPTVGAHTITVRIYDVYNDMGTASINITVNVPSPSISLTLPARSTPYAAPATLALTANASINYGSISKIEFYSNGNLLKTSYTSSYTYTWPNVPAGDYTLTAKAYSSQGTTSTATTNVKVYTTPGFITFDRQCRDKLPK